MNGEKHKAQAFKTSKRSSSRERIIHITHVLKKYSGIAGRVARNSQWGGCFWGVWGRSPQPPDASGGLGAKPPAAGGWGFGGKAPSRRRHGGSGGGAPSARKFCIFLQK